MKLVIVVALALVAVAVALPVEEPKVQIVRSEFEQKPDGPYISSFETDDGTKRQEEGTLKEALDEDNKPHTVITVRGQYSYIDPEGNTQTVTYYADESGYHAEGPSIPQAIQ